ncbi:hypothetical protein, partial [Planomonospora algeriensis]
MQDQDGRLWDLVWMTSCALRFRRPFHWEVDVPLDRVPRGGRARNPRRTTLTAHVRVGTDHRTVLIAVTCPAKPCPASSPASERAGRPVRPAL